MIAVLMAGAFSVATAQDYDDRGNDRGNSNKLDCSSGDGSRNNGLLDVIGGILGGRALNVVGLTDDYRLICFNERNPGNSRTIGNVAGLSGGDTYLVGIDFRPQDNKLYGVGDKGGIYTLDTNNAAATFVYRITTALSGASFGVDFNAAANALRITSDNGQNLRIGFATAPAFVTNVDDPLDYPVGINGVGPNAMGIAGSAYTNVDLDANTSVTLHALDSNLDQVAIQSPANDGTLAATGKLTVNTSAQVGFDNYSTIRNGVTVDNQAFASLTAEQGNAFYRVDLPTGKATFRGKFNNKDNVIGIAIPLNQR